MADIPERVTWPTLLADEDQRLTTRVNEEQIASRGGYKRPDGVTADESLQQMRVGDLRAMRQRLVAERKRIAALDKALGELLVVTTRAIS